MPHAVQIMAGVEKVIVGATATTTTTTESPKFTRTMSISTRPIRKWPPDQAAAQMTYQRWTDFEIGQRKMENGTECNYLIHVILLEEFQIKRYTCAEKKTNKTHKIIKKNIHNRQKHFHKMSCMHRLMFDNLKINWQNHRWLGITFVAFARATVWLITPIYTEYPSEPNLIDNLFINSICLKCII